MDPPQHPQPASNTSTGQSWFVPSFVGTSASNLSRDTALSDGDANSTGSPDGAGAPNPPSFSATVLNLFTELRNRLQPWSDFIRCSKFGLPPGIAAFAPRIKHNILTFLSNYLCLFIVLLVYCILTSLMMLLTLIVLAGLCYTIYQRTQKGPVVLGGHEIPPSLMYTLALMVCIPLFALSNAGQVMYWVIGSGLFLMLAHASFYCSEEVPGAEFEVVNVVPKN